MKDYKLKDKDIWDKINSDVGVIGGSYRLFSKLNDQRVTIQRFLGEDEEGLLYIGKANCFLSRVIALKKTIDPEYLSNPHICGRRYKLIDKIALKYPYEQLFVELFGSEDPWKKEAEQLSKYFEKFGEVPPLNAI